MAIVSVVQWLERDFGVHLTHETHTRTCTFGVVLTQVDTFTMVDREGSWICFIYKIPDAFEIENGQLKKLQLQSHIYKKIEVKSNGISDGIHLRRLF